jgi:hyperosmotically inducible protein
MKASPTAQQKESHAVPILLWYLDVLTDRRFYKEELMVRTCAGTMRAAVGLSLMTIAFASNGFSQQRPPDNTRVNQRDRDASQPTADKQSNNRPDIEITRDIRRAIVSDKHLSTYAHNVKVITQHGDVTLKGPVRTVDEKQVIEAKATDVAGAGHVNNEISVTKAPATRRTKSKA